MSFTCGANGRAGLERAWPGQCDAAAAHAIDGVLLLHPERQHMVLHPPRDRRWPRWRVAHLVGRRAGMVERAWQSSGAGSRTTATCRAARQAQRGRHDDMDGRVCEASGGFGILA